MNSKIILGIFLILSFGCGVKSNPLPPEGTALPSYIDHHSQKEKDSSKSKDKKEEEKKKENK